MRATVSETVFESRVSKRSFVVGGDFASDGLHGVSESVVPSAVSLMAAVTPAVLPMVALRWCGGGVNARAALAMAAPL